MGAARPEAGLAGKKRRSAGRPFDANSIWPVDGVETLAGMI